MKRGAQSMVWGFLAALAAVGLVYWWWKSPRQVVNRLYKYELGKTVAEGGGAAAYTAWETNLKTQGTELKTAALLHTYQEAKDYRAGKFPTRPKYSNHYGLGA